MKYENICLVGSSTVRAEFIGWVRVSEKKAFDSVASVIV
jgi:hypothetical protein